MVRLFSLCLFFMLVNNYVSHAQLDLSSKIDSIETLKDNKQKVKYYTILLQTQDTTKRSNTILKLYDKLSRAYSEQEDYESAVIFFKKLVQKEENKPDINLAILNTYRHRLADSYLNLGNYKDYVNTLDKIIKDNGDDKGTYDAFQKLAYVEIDNGDYDKALEYLNQGLSNKALCKTLENEIKLKLIIIMVYAEKYDSTFETITNNKDLHIARAHSERIENKFTSTSLRESALYDFYNNLAVIYHAYGESKKALVLYKKAKNFHFKHNNTYYAFKALMNIGIIYAEQKKIDEAKACFNTIIKQSNSPELKADVYDNMGYYLDTNNVEEKLPYFKKAINTSLNVPVAINENFKLPNLETIETSGNKQDILIYLIDLAQHEVKAYKQNSSSGYLKSALQTLTLIDKLVSLIRYETTSEQSKLFWIEKGVDSYMLAAEVSYLLNDTDKLFYFMEKNKALLLQESITTLQTRLESNIPNTILEREYALHYKRLDAYKNYQDNINNSKTQDNFVLQDKNYTVFMDSLQQHYPNYTKIKKQVDIADFKTVSANTNTCFIEYILNDTDGYGLLYCDNEVSIFKIKEVPTLQSQLITLKSYFTSPVLNANEKEDLQRKGQKVFSTLFPFPDAMNKLSGKHFTIIPDYTLETFPFEALSVSTEIPLKDSYFINNTEISYLQSFSAFKQIQQKQNTPEEKLLAIAPHTFTDQSLPELTGTKAIIDALTNYESSTILYETDATHVNFLKYRNNYEIIHLSTHAGTDTTQTPWIAFKDYNMSLNELYGLENQAELVVLDACETNTGALAIGEGTISLSRGFFFNGAQSVMASLWNVNEKSGNTVINQFYRELKNGVTKSKALQNSKTQYLENHEFSEALPYYWAAFTLTGSTKTIALSAKPPYILIFGSIGIVGLLAVALLWFRKRRIT